MAGGHEGVQIDERGRQQLVGLGGDESRVEKDDPQHQHNDPQAIDFADPTS